jgi:hypothetical protein
MTTDITTLLIQMVEKGVPQAGGLLTNNSALGSASDVLSLSANYAQLLGTAAPAALAAAGAILGVIAEGTESLLGAGAAEAAAVSAEVSAGLANPIVGAVVVIILTFILAMIDSLQNSEGGQQFTDLANSIDNNVNTSNYWEGKLTNSSLSDLWAPVGQFLDDLKREGTAGIDVTTQEVSQYHVKASEFVRQLVANPFGSDGYWEVYPEPAGDVPQASDPKPGWGTTGWRYESWYGHFPARSTIAGSPSGNVLDPRTIVPVLALGLKSYIQLESLASLIDPKQLTFQQFLSDFGPDFAEPGAKVCSSEAYINFLYCMYWRSVTGIVKTDLPSEDEILGALWWVTQIAGVFAHPSADPTRPTSQSWGAPWPFPRDQPGDAFSGNGWAWNLAYGASETYPLYGFYGNMQLDQTQRNLFTTAYIVSRADTTNMVSEWKNALVLYDVGSDTYVSSYGLTEWVIPWLQNKIILGRMARWKAIYLLNGFDRLWSLLQALQRLFVPNPPVVPTMLTLDQDQTIASGNWSARELCNIVKVSAVLLTGSEFVVTPQSTDFVVNWTSYSATKMTLISGYSVGGLLDFLYNVANGNWAGPPKLAGYRDLPGNPPKPLSFRGLLAGAAA